MTIEELFGTLQMSVVATWRKHLRSAKYGKHMALDEFYKEMPDKVDDLIEAWMGAYGKKIGVFQNILQSSNMNTLKYLNELKRVCKEGYALLDDNEELEGLLDDIVNLINSTLYKVKELSESNMMDLADFVNESLNESRGADLDQRTADRFFGDKFGRSRDLKTDISRSTKVLKGLKSELSNEEYDMLLKLVDNREGTYDQRSYVKFYDAGEYGAAEFNFSMNNMPKAIIHKLDDDVVKKINNIKHGYSSYLNTFGVHQSIHINITWDAEGHWASKSVYLEVIKYILNTIQPIFDDVIEWKNDSNDQDEINRRNRK